MPNAEPRGFWVKELSSLLKAGLMLRHWIYTFCSYCLFFRFWFGIPGKQVMEAHSWHPAKTYAFCWAPWLWGLNPTHGRLCILLVCSEEEYSEQLSWRWPVRLKNKQNEQQLAQVSFPPYYLERVLLLLFVVWFSGSEECLGWENLQQLWERQKLSKRRRTCTNLRCSSSLHSAPLQPWVYSLFDLAFEVVLSFKQFLLGVTNLLQRSYVFSKGILKPEHFHGNMVLLYFSSC